MTGLLDIAAPVRALRATTARGDADQMFAIDFYWADGAPYMALAIASAHGTADAPPSATRQPGSATATDCC